MSDHTLVRAVSGALPWLVTLSDEAGHEWLADEPAGSGGAQRGPTPTQLLLSGLGACTAITLRMYAARKGWTLRAVSVELSFRREEAPPGSLIERRIALDGDLDSEQRARLLEIANKCPLHRVLTGELRIASSLI